MPMTVTNGAAARHLERLEMVPAAMAKVDLKNLEMEWRQRIGRALLRAFAIAGLSQKEVAGLIGRDTGQVGRWLSGAERPQFDVLFAVEVLRQPLVLVVAELGGQSIEISTVVTLRRTA